MKRRQLHSRRAKAFSLVELLVVMAIAALLITGTVMSLRGIGTAGRFDKALGDISGLFEQARAYAVAQDTYVWVVLYENAPANGPLEVYARAFASSDGTDPFGWTGTMAFPTPGSYNGTALTAITRFYYFKGVHLQTASMPNAPSSPNLPATSPVFQCTGQNDSGSVALSGSSSTYWIIQFTPTGSARVSANPIDSIWLGLQPSLSQSVLDTHNIASMKVNGLNGMTTVYRQ
jgi:prepilin-type N-terminal cleavage/methylation domain-containing protein